MTDCNTSSQSLIEIINNSITDSDSESESKTNGNNFK